MQKIILFIWAMTLFSCSTNKVRYKMPASRFNTPEVTGGALLDMNMIGRVNINYGDSFRVTITDELQGNPKEDKLLEKSTQFGARLDLGLLNRIDLFWNYAFGTPAIGGIKWQFLGTPEKQSKTGLKGALALGYGHSISEKKSLPLSIGSPFFDYQFVNELKVFDLTLLVGYRFNDRLLAYINGVFSSYESNLEMISPSYQVQRMNFNSKSFGLILGAQYYWKSKKSFLLVELGGNQGRLKRIKMVNNIMTFGLNFGWILE